MRFFYSKSSEVLGPLQADALIKVIDENTLEWNEDGSMKEWLPAKDVLNDCFKNTDPNQYYYLINDTTFGPLSVDELIKVINTDTLVWKADVSMKEWLPAKKVYQLALLLYPKGPLVHLSLKGIKKADNKELFLYILSNNDIISCAKVKFLKEIEKVDNKELFLYTLRNNESISLGKVGSICDGIKFEFYSLILPLKEREILDSQLILISEYGKLDDVDLLNLLCDFTSEEFWKRAFIEIPFGREDIKHCFVELQFEYPFIGISKKH